MLLHKWRRSVLSHRHSQEVQVKWKGRKMKRTAQAHVVSDLSVSFVTRLLSSEVYQFYLAYHSLLYCWSRKNSLVTVQNVPTEVHNESFFIQPTALCVWSCILWIFLFSLPGKILFFRKLKLNVFKLLSFCFCGQGFLWTGFSVMAARVGSIFIVWVSIAEMSNPMKTSFVRAARRHLWAYVLVLNCPASLLTTYVSHPLIL